MKQQRGHESHQGIFQQQRPIGHNRLLAKVTIGPLLRWPEGLDLCLQMRLVVLGVLEFLFYPSQGVLTLLQTFAMPFGRRLRHLGPLLVKCLDLLGGALLSRLHRRLEGLACALLMAVGTDDLLASIVDIKGAMSDHALETVFLKLGSLAGHRGHSMTSTAALSAAVPQDTKVLPSWGSTRTKWRGSSSFLGAFHVPL